MSEEHPNNPENTIKIPKINPFKTTLDNIKPSKKWIGRFSKFCIALLALGAIAGLAYISYYFVQTFENIENKLSNVQKSGQEQNARLASSFSDYKKQAEQYNKKIEAHIEGQSVQLQQLSDKHNWHISEAVYLVSIAQERLNMVADIPTAIKLLQTANDRLKNFGDVRVGPVRESIARDIGNLEALVRFDKIGLWVELGVIRKQLANLSFHTLQASIEGQPEIVGSVEPTPVEQSAWRQALENTWQELKGLVRVREFNADKLNSSLEPRDQIPLLRVMDLMLVEAQWGLLQEEPRVFQQSLELLEEKLSVYFVQDELLKTIMAQINILKTKVIRQTGGDLSHTLNMLNALENASLRHKGAQS